MRSSLLYSTSLQCSYHFVLLWGVIHKYGKRLHGVLFQYPHLRSQRNINKNKQKRPGCLVSSVWRGMLCRKATLIRAVRQRYPLPSSLTNTLSLQPQTNQPQPLEITARLLAFPNVSKLQDLHPSIYLRSFAYRFLRSYPIFPTIPWR